MLTELRRRGRQALALLQPRALAIAPFRCPACGASALVRLAPTPLGVRCARCAASAATLSLIAVLRAARPQLARDEVYELSSRGPLVEFLRRRAAHLTCSEFFEDVAPGAVRDGVTCQDVQRLTFAAASFDVCTSTEVFEHVPDDLRGFREIRRVLRPGGLFVFTVPLADTALTVERARLQDGAVVHLLPPEYHGDRIRGQGRVLAFRNYGRDIVERLRACGFAEARIDRCFKETFLGHGVSVVVAGT